MESVNRASIRIRWAKPPARARLAQQAARNGEPLLLPPRQLLRPKALLATQAQRIASDDHQINMLHVRYETQSVFLDDEVVSEVQLLELNVLIFLIQRIRMKSLEFVSAQV